MENIALGSKGVKGPNFQRATNSLQHWTRDEELSKVARRMVIQLLEPNFLLSQLRLTKWNWQGTFATVEHC